MYSVLHSILNYAILAWGGAPSAAILFELQRKVVTIIAGLSYRKIVKNILDGLGY